MEESRIEVRPSCGFVKTNYGEGVRPDVSLDYTEHSPDGWYSDTETSIDIDELKAREIITFLQGAFGI